MTPRTKLLIVIPLIAVLVVVLIYFRLFESPLVVAIILVLYVAVTLRNRRKFGKRNTRSRNAVRLSAPT